MGLPQQVQFDNSRQFYSPGRYARSVNRVIRLANKKIFLPKSCLKVIYINQIFANVRETLGFVYIAKKWKKKKRRASRLAFVVLTGLEPVTSPM